MNYQEDDIKISSGEPRTKIDPQTSYLLGPTSEFDDVYVFDHKLDAYYFVKNFFDAQIDDAEMDALEGEIAVILKSQSDDETMDLTNMFEENESIEIYGEGYWESFVFSSQSFWPEWGALYKNDDLLIQDWDTEDEESDDYDADMDLDEDAEQESKNLLFSEPPDDVFNPEFVEEMLSIIPVA